MALIMTCTAEEAVADWLTDCLVNVSPGCGVGTDGLSGVKDRCRSNFEWFVSAAAGPMSITREDSEEVPCAMLKLVYWPLGHLH